MRAFVVYLALCTAYTQVLCKSNVNNIGHSVNATNKSAKPPKIVEIDDNLEKVNGTVPNGSGDNVNGTEILLSGPNDYNGRQPLIVIAEGLLKGYENGKGNSINRPVGLVFAPAELVDRPEDLMKNPVNIVKARPSRVNKPGNLANIPENLGPDSIKMPKPSAAYPVSRFGNPVKGSGNIVPPVEPVDGFSRPPQLTRPVDTVNGFGQVNEPEQFVNRPVGVNGVGEYVNVPGPTGNGGPGNLVSGIVNGHKVLYVVRPDGMGNDDICRRDVYKDYRASQIDFQSRLFKRIASHTDEFVFSPYLIWLTLAALAEGADDNIKGSLFKYLDLPQQLCLRQKYYDMALNSELPGRDVSLDKRRVLVLDEGVLVNPAWLNLVNSTGLLEVTNANIKSNSMADRLNIALKGNSLLLDFLDYHGLWTTEFSTVSVRGEPFFNDFGQQIGTINMMRLKKRTRMAYVPFLNAKVLELPVGVDGRYTMLIAMNIGNNAITNAIEPFMRSIDEIFSLLQMSLIPIEIALPEFRHEMEFDAREIVEEIGLGSFWTNTAATSYVSQPPAVPSGLVQLVTVNLGPDGINLPPVDTGALVQGLPQYGGSLATGLAPAVGHDFIANRPFLYGLFDTKTQTCVFAGVKGRQDRV